MNYKKIVAVTLLCCSAFTSVALATETLRPQKLEPKSNKQTVVTSKIPRPTTPAKKQQFKLVENTDGSYCFEGITIPKDYKEISIFGKSALMKSQAVAYIKQVNPNYKLTCTPEELVDYYWEEAELEGVRPDLALAQALIETGTFSYKGDVQPKQNNFCGLGATGNGVRGVVFPTAKIGARGHIQHLLAYSRVELPHTKIVDPRYNHAHSIRMSRGLVDKWSGLNGTWAMGSYYCEKIMSKHVRMMAMPMSDADKVLWQKMQKEQEKQDKKLKKQKKKKDKHDKKDKQKKRSDKEALKGILRR